MVRLSFSIQSGTSLLTTNRMMRNRQSLRDNADNLSQLTSPAGSDEEENGVRSPDGSNNLKTPSRGRKGQTVTVDKTSTHKNEASTDAMDVEGEDEEEEEDDDDEE